MCLPVCLFAWSHPSTFSFFLIMLLSQFLFLFWFFEDWSSYLTRHSALLSNLTFPSLFLCLLLSLRCNIVRYSTQFRLKVSTACLFFFLCRTLPVSHLSPSLSCRVSLHRDTQTFLLIIFIKLIYSPKEMYLTFTSPSLWGGGGK